MGRSEASPFMASNIWPPHVPLWAVLPVPEHVLAHLIFRIYGLCCAKDVLGS